MKFIRQWSGNSWPKTSIKGESMAVPNGALPLRKIVSRVQQGNMFGISMFNTSYDSDNGEIDENIPIISIYPNDPINSIHEIKDDLANLKIRAKDAIRAAKAAKKEEAVATVS